MHSQLNFNTVYGVCNDFVPVLRFGFNVYRAILSGRLADSEWIMFRLPMNMSGTVIYVVCSWILEPYSLPPTHRETPVVRDSPPGPVAG